MKKAAWSQVFASFTHQAFFEIVRHYLGPVKTPFHKPEIIDRLDAFFCSSDVLDRVLGYITKNDALVLTFIAFHDNPSEENMSRMISVLRPLTLRETLLNLEERLLIWKFHNRLSFKYQLSPLGEMVREAGILGPGAVIGKAIGTLPPTKKFSWFNDNFFTASLAFLSEGHPIFRKEGGWRKRTLDILEERFPNLFHDGLGRSRLLLAARGILNTGLAVRKDEYLEPRIHMWRDMEGQKSETRLAVLRAQAAVGPSLAMAAMEGALRLLTNDLPAGCTYPPERLAVLFQLGLPGTASLSPQGARRVIAHLKLMGELVSDENGALGRPFDESRHDEPPSLTVTATGDISLQPESPLFSDLALAAKSISTDIVTTFCIDKEHFLAGLDRDIDSQRFITALEFRSGRPVPPNLLTLLSEWETEYRTLSLQLCIVLTADGIRREIIESSGVLDAYTISKPAEGVWLLDPKEEPQWKEALQGVGIERVPPVIHGHRFPRTSEGPTPGLGPPYSLQAPKSLESELSTYTWDSHEERSLTMLRNELNSAAASTGLSPEEMENFKARLERRLILVSNQIRKDAWRFEVMTAKGLDYRGKLRLAEAAMSGHNERLTLTVAADTSLETLTIIPEKLIKDGDDHIIVGLRVPDEIEVQYAIRKISFLKRTKNSLF